ncbi:MAG: response regulator transcription factor [Acidimicrobiales bacterium]|nr:response regulator transcription factor [Acidimicrobiales bacterium]
MSAPPPRTTRVGLVDDQPLMRVAFRTILDSGGFEVVGEAADGDGAVRLATGSSPDVLLLDVRMPGRDGVWACAEIARRCPAVRVLILTTFDDDEVLHGALEAGAAGFLLKNSTPEQLLDAVGRLAAGDAVLDPAVTARVLQRLRRPATAGVAPPGEDRIRLLTERERDVYALVAQGLTNGEIAATLGMGEATAKTHVSHVLAKLGVRDRVQAVIHAYRHGFVR